MRLSYVLAREILYRARKSWSKKGIIAYKRAELSVIRSNALQVILYGLFSCFLALLVLVSRPEEVDKAFIAASILTILLTVFLLIIESASFTAVFASEGLLQILRSLPISRHEATCAYIEALFLYWGGLSALTPVALVLLAALIRTLSGALSPLHFVTLLVACLLCAMTSASVGVALGTYSSSVKCSPLMRTLSVFAWLALFLIWIGWQFAMGAIISTIREEQSLSPWLALIPFLGMLFVHVNPVRSIVSLALSIYFAFAAFRFAVNRFSLIEHVRTFPSTPPKWRGLTLRSPLWGYAVKDLKLLIREPRRLALVIYTLAILPFFFAWPFHSFLDPWDIAILAGSIAGMVGAEAILHLYFVEGKGAQLLYVLPLTRKRIALAKTLAAQVFVVASSLTVAVITFAFTRHLQASIYALLLGATIGILGSLITSSAVARALPEAPSEWSEESLGGLRHSLVILGLVAMLLVLAVSAIIVATDPVSAFALLAIPIAIVSLALYWHLENKPL